MAFETPPAPSPTDVTIHHVGQGNLAEHAARRAITELPGIRRAPLSDGASMPLPRGVVLAEIGDEVTRRRLCRAPGSDAADSAPVVAIVPDHEAGYAAIRCGAAHYILASDVDGPALPATMVVALRRCDPPVAPRPTLFAEGTREQCLSIPAFGWILRQTANALLRRGEVGYVLLVRLLPATDREPTADELSLLATSAAARLVGSIRSADVPARLDALTFALLVEVGLSLDGANTVIARLSKRLSEPYPIDGRMIATRVAVGLTTLGGETVSAEDIILRAQNALEESILQDRRHG